jgi:arylsulfatase
MDYQRWFAEHMFMVAPAAGYVGQWRQRFPEFPPLRSPAAATDATLVTALNQRPSRIR